MRRAVVKFAEAARDLPLAWLRQPEQDFAITLDGTPVHGRIDRLDRSPDGRALVIDYKYSRDADQYADEDDGTRVQGGLYLLAAERQFGLEPAGMLYCAFKRGAAWRGWHVPLPGLGNFGEVCSAEALRERINTAVERTLAARDRIRAGVCAPRPADARRCQWCDYRDICRIETEQPRAREAGE
jgi:RecB family exonuclease